MSQLRRDTLLLIKRHFCLDLWVLSSLMSEDLKRVVWPCLKERTRENGGGGDWLTDVGTGLSTV